MCGPHNSPHAFKKKSAIILCSFKPCFSSFFNFQFLYIFELNGKIIAFIRKITFSKIQLDDQHFDIFHSQLNTKKSRLVGFQKETSYINGFILPPKDGKVFLFLLLGTGWSILRQRLRRLASESVILVNIEQI